MFMWRGIVHKNSFGRFLRCLTMENDVCVICSVPGVPNEDLQPVQEKGCATILKYFTIVDDTYPDITNTLGKKQEDGENIFIHRNCQRGINCLLTIIRAPLDMKTQERDCRGDLS